MISDAVQLALIAGAAATVAAIPPTILALATFRSSKRVETKAVAIESKADTIVDKTVDIKKNVDGNYSDLKNELIEAKHQIALLNERLIATIPSSIAGNIGDRVTDERKK